MWAAALGPAGAGAHKAVSTLDSMVGHRTERYREFGWASARLDDAAAYVPARVTALLVAAVRPRQAGAVWRAVARRRPRPPLAQRRRRRGRLRRRPGPPPRRPDRLRRSGRRRARPSATAPRPRPADIASATALSRDVALALAAALIAAAILVTARRRFRTEPGAETRGRRE